MVIFDSLSGNKKKLFLSKKRRLKMFVCGPTVYNYIHIGNARSYLVFDVIARWLKYKGVNLKYVQNITDVDDKIINRAREEKKQPKEITSFFLKKYLETMKKLNISSINAYIKASKKIPAIISQVKRLVEKGYAYETENGVYFEVRKFKKYGLLSGQNLEELRPGWRIEEDPKKHDPLDFAVWKKKKDSFEPSWKSPFGEGRPGWHIEDTAIAEKYLGLQYDIHGGGVDLKFPHHEAEIAQAEALSGKHPFVSIWMHNGLINVNGEKMAKSGDNFITAADFLKKFHPDVLRFISISSHYRSPLNFNEETIKQAISSLFGIKSFLARLSSFLNSDKNKKEERVKVKSLISSLLKDFKKNMDDDFNTPRSLASVFSFINTLSGLFPLSKLEAKAAFSVLTDIFSILGFNLKFHPIPEKIKEITEAREVLRTVHNFAKADELRKKIESLGYKIEDGKTGAIIIKNDLEIILQPSLSE